MFKETFCSDPGSEDDYNDWYNNVHIPDIMENKAIKKITRFEIIDRVENNDKGKGKYLCLWEIETDDLDAVMDYHEKNMKKKEQEGRFFTLGRGGSRRMYKQIYDSSHRKA
jgi:hypothetical protein